jgi:hypothetical protein
VFNFSDKSVIEFDGSGRKVEDPIEVPKTSEGMEGVRISA